MKHRTWKRRKPSRTNRYIEKQTFCCFAFLFDALEYERSQEARLARTDERSKDQQVNALRLQLALARTNGAALLLKRGDGSTAMDEPWVGQWPKERCRYCDAPRHNFAVAEPPETPVALDGGTPRAVVPPLTTAPAPRRRCCGSVSQTTMEQFADRRIRTE